MNARIAGRGLRHIFIRDLVLQASIGVYPHEHEDLQQVRINIDAGVLDEVQYPNHDHLSRVVNYEKIALVARQIVAAGHIMLVETLAERIAESCLLDTRILLVRVRVEKLNVFADAASAGVEIERRMPSCPPTAIDSQ